MKKKLMYVCEPMTQEMYWYEHGTNLWKKMIDIDIRRGCGSIAMLRTKKQVIDMVDKNPQIAFDVDLERNTKSGRTFLKNWLWHNNDITPENLATARAYKEERYGCT